MFFYQHLNVLMDLTSDTISIYLKSKQDLNSKVKVEIE